MIRAYCVRRTSARKTHTHRNWVENLAESLAELPHTVNGISCPAPSSSPASGTTSPHTNAAHLFPAEHYAFILRFPIRSFSIDACINNH